MPTALSLPILQKILIQIDPYPVTYITEPFKLSVAWWLENWASYRKVASMIQFK